MPRPAPPAPPRDYKDEENEKNLQHDALSMASTSRVITCLRIALLLVLLATTALASTGVYRYTQNEEHDNFTGHFEDSALQIIETFHGTIERSVGAAAAMSTAITSYANEANQSFPFLTLPDFELRASHLRRQSGAFVAHWLPLVTDEKREEWETYAYNNRGQINTAFRNDMYYRSRQDAELGLGQSQSQRQRQRQRQRSLLEEEEESERNATVLDDGTGYHPRIWTNGAMGIKGDAPEGNGPFLPTWQRSPIDVGQQNHLNMNMAETKALGPGLLDNILDEKKAVLRNAFVPIPRMRSFLEANLRLSQYRDQAEDFVTGPSTYIVYPVFDSFDHDDDEQNNNNKNIAGFLAANVNWRFLFSNILPASSKGIICVVENSFNLTFAYRVDGSDAAFIGMGDPHDPKYDKHEISMNVNEYLKAQASPLNRAYATVPLSDQTIYTIRVYPSQETEDMFVTGNPVVYTVIVISGFVFVSILFFVFSCAVEKRQHIMMRQVIDNANKAANAERELNEFLSHEVRNPLSAAISACSFVSTAVNEEPQPLVNMETRKYVRDDIEVVTSSLHFINDFLRSVLDIHRADGNQIKIDKSPTDLLKDVLEPISVVLYKRMASFEVIVDCPSSLIVLTDSIRLKQVVLNLVRNSSKFVERGFLQMRAEILGPDRQIRLYVEDSGPGVPVEKRKDLFSKYQQSLDLLSQGTGLGLSLSRKLMRSMGGDIWLDATYDSGIDGCPGACFVVQLNTAPVDIEATLPAESESREVYQQAALGGSDVHTIRLGHMEDQTRNDTLDIGVVEQAKDDDELPEKLSVLFVDDDAIVRRLFIRAVKRAQPQWTIQEASSGETALQLCESESFDIIFMDQYMASVDKQLLGTEATQALRSKGVASKICGLSANDIRDSFINSGADDFILKPMPCKIDELREGLMRILNKDSI